VSADVAKLYAELSGRVLAYATKLVGAAGEDVAAEAWRQFLTLREKDPRLLWVITKRAAYRHRFKESRERAKRAMMTAGEEVKGAAPRKKQRCTVTDGVNTCGAFTTRKDVCECHYYRMRRTGSYGTVEVGPTFKEKQKVTDSQVADIRRRLAAGEREAALAKEYGIGPAQVSRIRNGRRRGGPKAPKLTPGFRSDLRRDTRMSLVRGGTP
jgi:hypothetical protein